MYAYACASDLNDTSTLIFSEKSLFTKMRTAKTNTMQNNDNVGQ